MVRRALLPLSAALASAFMLACPASRTEVLLVVDVDDSVVSRIDGVRILAGAPSGATETASASVERLPRTLGLTWSRGTPLTPYTAEVRGTLAGSPVITRSVSFAFIQGETRVLRIGLTASCLTVTCPTGQTCSGGVCRVIEVEPTELEPYGGAVNRWLGAAIPDAPRDAGTAPRDTWTAPVDARNSPMDAWRPRVDATTCSSTDEVCNEADDDCDGNVDEDFDLSSDPANCGVCGNACPSAGPHASYTCARSRCAIDVCDEGWDDCNRDAADGCEADLTRPTHCGSCGNICRPPESMCCPTGCARMC